MATGRTSIVRMDVPRPASPFYERDRTDRGKVLRVETAQACVKRAWLVQCGAEIMTRLIPGHPSCDRPVPELLSMVCSE